MIGWSCRRALRPAPDPVTAGAGARLRPHPGILLCADGLRSYVSQARRVYREAVPAGKPGRPRLALPTGVPIAQAVKQYAKWRVAGVVQCVAQGTVERCGRA